MTTPASRVDAVVVGAGFAGLYTMYRFRQLGLRVQAFEAASDVGGTWWWNRYPGARCDIQSVDYSYSFSPDLDQEWTWSERYATQPEILRYANHVADRFDLRRDVQFETRVEAATWHDDSQRWSVTTDRGDEVSARFLVMATGCLSTTKQVDIEGLDSFAGQVLHTGRWPHEPVDLHDRRVGVIGTGSSAIQSIPLLAEQAAHLTVFQRTPAYSMPAQNAPLTDEQIAAMKASFPEHREQARHTHGGVVGAPRPETPALAAPPDEREATYAAAWQQGTLHALLGCYNDLLLDPDANETVAEFIRNRIRSIVNDPDVAEKLAPRSYPFGTKRPCLDTNYYATYNRPNVSLVDLRETPIVAVEPAGVRTSAGFHELDTIVLATGFDAMTGPLLGPLITGRGGRTLREAWADGPVTYLGLAVAGFPNMFTITGPGSPSVLTNMMVSIEQHVEWISDCIAHLDAHGQSTIEATAEAQEAWTAHVAEVAEHTLMPRANSWYMGANVPGKPRVFMAYIAGHGTYRDICDGVAADGYRGFTLTPAEAVAAAGQ
jgi:cation diffusion facilitator CzcD-associated flavoprotein CzcO